MKAVGIIPARMAASRFPGKPLARMAGYSMIEHVYRRAQRCAGLSEVYVATPDREICEATVGFGGKALMTANTHVRCTDRVAEAANAVDADIVINIQGDEPLIHPDAIGLLCDVMRRTAAIDCVNLANTITSEADFLNPNQIKIVCDRQGNALYMSRRPIPTGRAADSTVLRQMGLIAFRRGFLETFARLPPTPLEQAESIDMLRAIEHGYRVRIVASSFESFGVDTPEDLKAAEARLAADPLTAELFSANSPW